MVARIHVNQHVIKSNHKTGEREPALTVKTYKGNEKASEVAIVAGGEVVARLVYRPDKPLDCGARVWIETERERLVLINNDVDNIILDAVLDAEAR